MKTRSLLIQMNGDDNQRRKKVTQIIQSSPMIAERSKTGIENTFYSSANLVFYMNISTCNENLVATISLLYNLSIC